MASSSNFWSIIFRTSTALESGEVPKGRIRARYGGVPPEPVMLILSLPHCVGVLSILNEKALAKGSKEDMRVLVDATATKFIEDNVLRLVDGDIIEESLVGRSIDDGVRGKED